MRPHEAVVSSHCSFRSIYRHLSAAPHQIVPARTASVDRRRRRRARDGEDSAGASARCPRFGRWRVAGRFCWQTARRCGRAGCDGADDWDAPYTRRQGRRRGSSPARVRGRRGAPLLQSTSSRGELPHQRQLISGSIRSRFAANFSGIWLFVGLVFVVLGGDFHCLCRWNELDGG